MKVEDIWAACTSWLYTNVLNFDTVYQIIVLFSAGIFSFIVFKAIKKPTRKKIEQLKISMRNKRIAYNIHKLLLYGIFLITIVILKRTLQADIPDINLWLIEGIEKTLMAWIAVRVMVQTIENEPIRNTISTIICALAALSIFGIMDDTTKILETLSVKFGTFNLSALMIIKGALYLFVLIYFSSFLTSLAERKINKSQTLARSSKLLITKIIRISLVTIALILGLMASGLDLSLFAVFGGAVGLGVGLGLQRSVSNLFSGILLLLDRSIEPGDIIELPNGTFGWVKTIGGRQTEILTGDNKTHLIPNEELVTQRVVNWSHDNSEIRIAVDFGVHYNSDPHDVIKIAIKTAQTVKRVLKKPEPTCFITAFADNSINFSLGFWINDAQEGIGNVKGEILLALWDEFKKNNIEIPYPHREIYVHNADAAEPKL